MAVYAFFEDARGPCKTVGVSLHYVLNRQNICENYVRLREDEQIDYWTPHIDWWTSKEAYAARKKGFNGKTCLHVEDQYPDITICKDRATAIRLATMSPEEAEEALDYGDLDWQLIGCYS